ncbi:DUF4328 domain-containing protein [Planobispora takensis]|uniref:DUF4328 domain-containing protein n=1 Tax=Planobispora takensis TaxID=1367882 RepID=A0A8J3WV98_9ACTN|nr:DUF4328 domain-containing protein [Planobispora takensis]GII03729.1 hypothetical protein Pta02_57370 [Planobispora takensis]
MRRASSPRRQPVTAVYATLAAQVAATAALVVFEYARGSRLAREMSAFSGDTRAPGAQALIGAATVFAILIIAVTVTTVAAVAVYLVWLARAWRAAGSPGLPVGRVLAGWLVPPLNLLAPPVLLDRLWRASHPPAGRRGPWLALLTAWWLSCLTLLVMVARRALPGSPAEAGLTGLGPAELAAAAMACLLCATTVRQISGAQAEARHRRRAPSPATRPTTPQAATN